MSSGRLGAILALGVVVVGSQPAEGQQQRLLVLPFEIGAPQDSAISQELAAIVREQLAAALIGEIRVVPESQRASAYQAAGFAPKAIVSRVLARQLAMFLRADLYVIASLPPSGTMIAVELRALADDASRMSTTIACRFRRDPVSCGGMVVDSILPVVR